MTHEETHAEGHAEGPAGDASVRSGGCLCRRIRYEVRGDLGPIVFCHCEQCRRASGTAFATNSPIRANQFRLLPGAAEPREYESSPGKLRAFCGDCGSPIYSRRAAHPEVLRVRVGTLDTPLNARPAAHIYATSKPDWDAIHDELPQFAAGVPEAFVPGR
jgi:hypothetical protein